MTAFTFEDDDVVLTTGHSIEGHEIVEYLGIVVADVRPGRHLGKDLASGLRDAVGGRSKSWEMPLEENQEVALGELIDEARDRGANAVVGLHVEDETMGGQGGMMNVKAIGTAVRAE
ncbi:MAG: YbjQ family protein [Halobacteriales archaeon]